MIFFSLCISLNLKQSLEKPYFRGELMKLFAWNERIAPSYDTQGYKFLRPLFFSENASES